MDAPLNSTDQQKLLELEREKILSEEQLKITQIIDSANASIYWKDRDGRYLGCNAYVLDMAGLSDRSQIIGKTDVDLVWKNAGASEAMTVDRFVVENGRFVGEETFTIANGMEVTYLTEKRQLFNNKGEVIGTVGTSIDITERKETEQLKQQKIELQEIALQEKEKLITLAHKVAHDISSPLSALSMMMGFCEELPADKRAVIKSATESIFDIANNLLTTYRNENKDIAAGTEPRQLVLVSDMLGQLLSEKKVQYSNHAIKFETLIADHTQFAFINVQKSELRRSLSNLVNNAVDALSSVTDGMVALQLTATDEMVIVEVKDNGHGISEQNIQKIQRHQEFTEGKAQGHGLGLQQVWDMLEHNEGHLDVQSKVGAGTTIQLSFRQADAATWIAKEINLAPNQIIIILDDEESIHGAWKQRFTPLLSTYSSLRLYHFTQGEKVLNFLNAITQEERNRVLLLSDYELLHQAKNGLQIISASQLNMAVLVTSHYSDLTVREEAAQLDIKILPKQMASVVPIVTG